MIKTLTKKQKNGITEWKEQCLKIGRDTSPINKELTENSWKKFYKMLDKKDPKFWYCQSPMQANIVINILQNLYKNSMDNIQGNIWDNLGVNIGVKIQEDIWNNIRKDIWENIRKDIWNNIWNNIWDNIQGNIGDNLGVSIRDNLGVNIGVNIQKNIVENIQEIVWENLGDNVKENIWDNALNNILKNIEKNIWKTIEKNVRENIRDKSRKSIGENIGNKIKENIGENIWRNVWDKIRENIQDNIRDNIKINTAEIKFKQISLYSGGQHDISWISYYKYFKDFGLLPNDKNFEIFDIWYDLAKSCGWCYTFEDIVFVCEKPCELNLDANGLLHKDGSMALKYSDGYGLYMLNGTSVPKYLAVTPESDLDIEFFKKEKNADVKAEFIRKYGIDRMKSLGNVIDTWKNYTGNEWWVKSEYILIDMANIFKSIKYAPFLNMKNQTLEGVFHLEGVDPGCKNLKEAISWREGIKSENYKTLEIK